MLEGDWPVATTRPRLTCCLQSLLESIELIHQALWQSRAKLLEVSTNIGNFGQPTFAIDLQ